MSTTIEALSTVNPTDMPSDIENVFRAHYGRVARIIARIVRDRSRAKELAVEVFLKLWRNSKAPPDRVQAWLYRVAVRTALDEVRGRTRRLRYENLFSIVTARPAPPTPEQLHSAAEEQERVRFVLCRLERRQAEFLVLRSHGFSYEELAFILDMNPASIGSLLSRAHEAFRKEYVRRYGHN